MNYSYLVKCHMFYRKHPSNISRNSRNTTKRRQLLLWPNWNEKNQSFFMRSSDFHQKQYCFYQSSAILINFWSDRRKMLTVPLWWFMGPFSCSWKNVLNISRLRKNMTCPPKLVKILLIGHYSTYWMSLIKLVGDITYSNPFFLFPKKLTYSVDKISILLSMYSIK